MYEIINFKIIEISLFSSNSLTDGSRNLMVKCASITLYDIPSKEKPGSILGSLVFSETFLDSEIKVATTGK
jgi:hypothetical protein